MTRTIKSRFMNTITNSAHAVRKISPMLAVADMEETLAFYRDILGFTATLHTPEYSIVERDGATIHFMKATSQHVLDCVRGHTEIYLEVSGIHRFWQHVKMYCDVYRVRELFDREYGMTEFHIEDPNGCLVLVGEPTAKCNSEYSSE
jgi:catechol 2,3-dioxygenase-like lactoylglutathione lyase family enzyme